MVPKRLDQGLQAGGRKILGGIEGTVSSACDFGARRTGNWIEIPSLGEEFLAMSLGVEYSVRRLKPGRLGEITVVQETTTPKIDREKQCYALEQTVVGGFTLALEAFDSREVVAKYDKV